MASKKTEPRSRSKSYYPLSEVRQLIQRGRVLIRSNAKRDAMRCFGWGMDNILDAFLKLKPQHFYKTDVSRINPENVIDYYKARGLKGENIYTHFYIDDEAEFLIINSFKKI